MKDWTFENIKEYGFKGFVKISDLISDYELIPDERGVYLILMHEKNVNFLTRGTGGYFKNKNPNVGVDFLKDNWVDLSAIVYIGQAGGTRNGKWSKSTLKLRLKKYLQFGQGKPVGHW